MEYEGLCPLLRKGDKIFMKKIAVVTDSNSNITQQEAKELKDVYVIPMPFIVDGEEYFEDVNLTQEGFYEKLLAGADISTSQPSVGQVTELWDELLKKYDQIVHIPMSSALSESCNSAKNFAKEYNGRVVVVDNRRISITLRQSVLDALTLAKKGYDGEEIRQELEETQSDSSIYIMVDTLKYLKKGGRITPAAAAIGTLLKIKPVLQIQGGKLDQYAKVMNEKVARTKMIGAMKHDFETRFAEFVANGEIEIEMAYTNCVGKAEEFKKQVQEAFPNVKIGPMVPLPLSIACHIGSGALAVACARVVK